METIGNHTPGPWKATAQQVIYAKNGTIIVAKSYGPAGAWIDVMDEYKANAALIAAAPALAEALKEVTERYALLDKRLVAGQHDEPNGTILRARAALAKAGY